MIGISRETSNSNWNPRSVLSKGHEFNALKSTGVEEFGEELYFEETRFNRVMKSKGRGGRDTCKRIQNLIQNNRFGRKFGLFRVEFFIQNTKFLLETANS